MKKTIYMLGALFAALMITSCAKPIEKLEAQIDDVKENGKQWDADQWEAFMRETAETELAFWQSEPTKEDIKAYDKLKNKAQKAMAKVLDNSKAEKAFTKAMKALDKDDDYEQIEKDMKKAERKARKAANKRKSNDDEEEEEEDEEEEE